jgi:hypothetical protein
MTKFQLGLAIGFFLGALVMFVVLGIIQLYVEERRGKLVLPNKSAAWEDEPDNRRMQVHADCGVPIRFPAAVSKEQADNESIIYYLFILIE